MDLKEKKIRVREGDDSSKYVAPVAQWSESSFSARLVVGSNPARCSKALKNFIFFYIYYSVGGDG